MKIFKQFDPKIIFESVDCLVINKPAGLAVHGDGVHTGYTLSDWLAERYKDIVNVGESAEYSGVKVLRPGIVHRLDRDTSGVMVVAKTQEMFVCLKRQFADRVVVKQYDSVCYGAILESQFRIDAPLGRSMGDIEKRAVGSRVRGVAREALTYVRVLARTTLTGASKFSYVSAVPKTGRTHQIRVHLASIGHPLVGDVLYAGRNAVLDVDSSGLHAFGFGRQALHSRSISFSDLSGVARNYVAPYPDDFVRARGAFGLEC